MLDFLGEHQLACARILWQKKHGKWIVESTCSIFPHSSPGAIFLSNIFLRIKSGTPLEAVPNIPVRPNRNGPFNLYSDRNFQNFWNNASAYNIISSLESVSLLLIIKREWRNTQDSRQTYISITFQTHFISQICSNIVQRFKTAQIKLYKTFNGTVNLYRY